MSGTRRMWGAALAGCVLVGATTARAQACLGLADLAAAPRVLSSTGAGTDLGRTLEVRYGMAGERVFGGAQLGFTGRGFSDVRAPLVGGDLGVVLPLGLSGATQLCPTVSTEYQRDRGRAFIRNRLASSLGLAMGRTFTLSSSVALAPFMQGGVQHLHQAFAVTSVGTAPDGTPRPGRWGATNEVFAEMAVGVGLRVNRRFTITPSYRVPLGLSDPDRSALGALSVQNRLGLPQQTYAVSLTLGFPR
ncbi:MAG: hypothetical protein MUE41_02445 [Gemmatimonadaceae bacterium]|nr:hypothetical protein [Gemmatimonadaceae bacterium]